MYALEVSPEFISKVTDAVMGEVVAWQSRPLEPMYPVVFFDALRVKVREDALVRNKAVYLALGVQAKGTRGVGDILVAVADGLTGLPGALEAVFPRTTLQTCAQHPNFANLLRQKQKRRRGLSTASCVNWRSRFRLQPALK